MGKTPTIYRCNCGKLLRQSDISKGVCSGHQVHFAKDGSIFEFLKIKYWELTGAL